MKHWLRLYYFFVKTSIITDLQYRGNFFLLILVYTLWGGAYLSLYLFIFQHLEGVADWNLQRSLTLSATFLIIHALNRMFFARNLRCFPQLVYQGDLDLILIKPISSQFFVSLRRFNFIPLLRFFISCLILILILRQNAAEISFLSFINYFLFLIIATIITYSLWFMICCSIFWLGNIENIFELFHPIFRMTNFPLDILPTILKEILFFIIPLAFITTVPAKALFGFISWPTVFYGIFISLFFFFLSTRLWHLALKTYSSVSS
jgi:ABC-2 type transport system permease protein